MQIYVAPLVLSPTKSKIKEYYWKERHPLIKNVAGVKDDWDFYLQVLDNGLDANEILGNSMDHVTFSPDGKTLAAASGWNLRLWDTATGFCKQELLSLGSHPRFSPDSKTLISISAGNFLIWDLTTLATNMLPDKIGTLWITDFHPRPVCISPDARTVARGSEGGTLVIWDTLASTSKKTSEGHGEEIRHIAYSTDSKKIVSSTRHGEIRVWDAATTLCSRILEVPGDLEESDSDELVKGGISLSPSGKTLASATSSGILLWNIDNGDCSVLVKGPCLGSCIVFSPDGRTIALDVGYSIKLFNAVTGSLVKTLRGHTDSINSLAFSPDGQTLASASDDFKGRVWDASATASGQPIEEPFEDIECVGLSPDGKTIAIGTKNSVQLRDVRTGVCTRTLEDHLVKATIFSPDGKTLATSSYTHADIWSLATGDRDHNLEWTCSGYVALSPSSKLFAVASFNLVPPHSVLLLDVATGKRVQILDVPEQSGALAISPDDKTVVAVVRSNLFVWDVASGTRREVPLDLEGWYPRSIRYSEDGQYLVTNKGWFDPSSGKPVPISSLQRQPTGLLFVEDEWVTRDGQKVLWLPPEYKTQLWDTSSNEVVFINKLGEATVFEFA